MRVLSIADTWNYLSCRCASRGYVILKAQLRVTQAIGRADRSISFNSDALTSLRDIVYVASLLIPTLQAVCELHQTGQKLGVQFMLDIDSAQEDAPSDASQNSPIIFALTKFMFFVQ